MLMQKPELQQMKHCQLSRSVAVKQQECPSLASQKHCLYLRQPLFPTRTCRWEPSSLLPAPDHSVSLHLESSDLNRNTLATIKQHTGQF